MNSLLRSVCGFLLSVCFLSSSSAETAIFPAALANVDGRNLNQDGVEVPMVPWPNDVSKAHGIYDGAGFAASGPIRITEFNLRPDRDSMFGSMIGYENLKLAFAVTQEIPQHLEGMFANNIASAITEPVTVFDQPWESKVETPLPASGTRPFDFQVELTTPFVFDPSEGNLLVEWVIGLPTHPETRFDRESERGAYPDQATSFALGVDPVGGGGVGGFSVVTQFVFEPVPEPSFGFPTAIIVLALVGQFRVKR